MARLVHLWFQSWSSEEQNEDSVILNRPVQFGGNGHSLKNKINNFLDICDFWKLVRDGSNMPTDSFYFLKPIGRFMFQVK